MRAVLAAVVIVFAATGCTRRQDDAQCIAGDQKGCPCLGGGDGVQVCQANGTYAACECLPIDMSAPDGGSDDMAATTIGLDDMAMTNMSTDLAGHDMLSLVDAGEPDGGSGCVGGTPDEDADGRANACDLCPADADPSPVDSDGDGLPDACDPDPMMKTNTLVYFEPFETTTGHWSGTNQITQSYINIDTNGVASDIAGNGTDSLPLNVRVQTIDFLKSVYGTNGGDTGLFVGTNADMSQAIGVFCALASNGGPDTLNIYTVNSGTLSAPKTQSLGSPLMMAIYRLRLTESDGVWTCEALISNTPVTVSTAQPVTAPLYIALRNDNMDSHFHSVVVESLATRFVDIQSDLDAKGCTITACHGTSGDGSVMYVKPTASTLADLMTNYSDFMAEVNTTTPSQSPVLTKPLPGSSHAGGVQFTGTNDPVYQRWLSWITAGAPF